MMDILNNFFDKVFYINLERRNDRRIKVEETLINSGIKNFERFEGVDGQQIDFSKYKKEIKLLKGELGILETHISLIQKAKDENLQSILIFEDDILFTNEIGKVKEYLESVPSDWDMIYFGGNHRYGKTPVKINDKVLKINKTVSAHCIGIRSTMYDTILALISDRKKPIDYYYASIQTIFNCYCFTPSIGLQEIGFSDIQNKFVNYNRYFK